MLCPSGPGAGHHHWSSVTQARVNLCTQAEAKMRLQASASKLGESGPFRCGLLKGKIQGAFPKRHLSREIFLDKSSRLWAK